MLHLVPKTPSPDVRSHCPDCDAELTILRIISGRGGAEYWTLRCTECGGRVRSDLVVAIVPSALCPRDAVAPP